MNKTTPPSATAREARVRDLEAHDELAPMRDRFHIPCDERGAELAYFAGNSLGLEPKTARALVNEELDAWAELGVAGHFKERRPWFSYHELARQSLARIVGANEREVVAMNSLTVNLHLLMASFYQPTPDRFRIVIEDTAFPSDSYAVASQAAFHGFDPADAIVRLTPRAGEDCLRTEDIEERLDREGQSIALVLLGGVNYLTGQLFDMERLTRAGRAAGAVVGWDLAHAAGNAPLRLHDWNVDFAAWCSYKYLNAGAGAVAGCFVHEMHWKIGAVSRPRLEGWWGSDPVSRFQMAPEFAPAPGADAWQLSNPPILSMAPLLASLAIFDEVGMDRLREKSLRLTGYLEELLAGLGDRVRVITPTDPAQRGCQLSIAINKKAKAVQSQLSAAGVVCDFREPNILRAAPTPLYNTFHDCWRLASTLATALDSSH